MPKKKPSDKWKTLEKDRRERLNKAFEELAKLIPKYDPTITWSKIEILQKSIDHIKDLHKQHEEFLQSRDPKALKQYHDLIEGIKYYQSRNAQIAGLLAKANISLPAFKLPAFIANNPTFFEENATNNISTKPVGRPGKYINKISKENAQKFEVSEANFGSTKPNPASSVVTVYADKGGLAGQKENISPAVPGAVATASSTFTKPALATGILVPVIPIQPQPVVHQAVNSSQIPTQVIPIVASLPPLIKVTSTPKSIKATTISRPSKTNRDKNAKIKILPQPQIKFYFRRDDGKVPIPVLKKKIIVVKKKRRSKRKISTDTNLKKKVLKIQANTEQEKRNEAETSASDCPKGTLTELNTTLGRTDDEKLKEKEHLSVSCDEMQNEYLSSINIAQSATNSHSVSPTAAFLMSFPVVNTSSGKFTEEGDVGTILTPNLDRKDHGVDNLENLNNFFATKEYTKYCGESLERDETRKTHESFAILEDIKIAPPSEYVPNTSTLNPVDVTAAAVIPPPLVKTSYATALHTPLCSISDKRSSTLKNSPQPKRIPHKDEKFDVRLSPPLLHFTTSHQTKTSQSHFLPPSTSIAATTLVQTTSTRPTSHGVANSGQFAVSSLVTSQYNNSPYSTTTFPQSSTPSMPSTITTFAPSSFSHLQSWPAAKPVGTGNTSCNQILPVSRVPSCYPSWTNALNSNLTSHNSLSSLDASPTAVFSDAGVSKTSQSVLPRNPFPLTTTTVNSLTSAAPKCTPLPLESARAKMFNPQTFAKSSLTSSLSYSETQTHNYLCNTSAPINSQQKMSPFPSSVSNIKTSSGDFLLSKPVQSSNVSNFNFATNYSQAAPVQSSASATSACTVAHSTFPNYTSTTLNFVSSNQKNKITASSETHANAALVASSEPSTLSYAPLPTTVSSTFTKTNPTYSQNSSQNVSNTGSYLYSSTASYFYPQANTNFSIALPNTSSSSQAIASQNILSYPPINDMSWMTPVTSDYKPSFTFSLTPTTITSTTVFKESTQNTCMSSLNKVTGFPGVSKGNEGAPKSVFNPFETPTVSKVTSNLKTALPNPIMSTNFTFSLTNPTSTRTTTESKGNFSVLPAKQVQQFTNSDAKYQNNSHQMFSFNTPLEGTQKDSCFTFALTKPSKTAPVAQKSAHSFTIDAQLGIANNNNNNCFIENNRKYTSGSAYSRSENKNVPTELKLNPKTARTDITPLNANSFYDCNQKVEKPVQKGHVNWMTSTDMVSGSSDCAQPSYRMATDPYHSYSLCDESLLAWSPGKMYDSSHLVTTIPAYYDTTFNNPVYNIAPSVPDTKVGKDCKSTSANINQANFLSVSQLVDQGYQKKSTSKFKDNRKQSDFKAPYSSSATQPLFHENSLCNSHSKPQVSNNYSAEALISKKEKHKNFSTVPGQDFYNTVDPSGVAYNNPDQSDQNYNSNYFYNYSANQNYAQESDYLGAYSGENQFTKSTNTKSDKKLPPPPPPNFISYDSNYFSVPLAVNSPIDSYDPHSYNHSGNFQSNNWSSKTTTNFPSYHHQNQHFPSSSDMGQLGTDHVQNNVQPAIPGNLTNFNLSSICPEINAKVRAPNDW